MDGVICYLSFAFFAVELLFLYWPALLVVALGIVGASAVARRNPAARFRGPLLWSLVQFLVPAAILLVGVLLRWKGPDDTEPPQWPARLINWMIWGHVPITGFLVLWFRGARWFVFAVSVAILGYSLSAAIVSGMSVTGDWL